MCLTCHRAHASGFGYMMRWGADNISSMKAFILAQTTNLQQPAGEQPLSCSRRTTAGRHRSLGIAGKVYAINAMAVIEQIKPEPEWGT